MIIKAAGVGMLIILKRFLDSKTTTTTTTTGLLLLVLLLVFDNNHIHAQQKEPLSPPQLNGQHFRITVLEERGFLDIHDDDDNGGLSYSGYLIELIQALAQPHRANFTYKLQPPSGYGSRCVPRLAAPPPDNADDRKNNNQSETSAVDSSMVVDATEQTTGTTTQPFDAVYRTQYNCGASDVNDYTIQTNNILQSPNFQSNDSIIGDDYNSNYANNETMVVPSSWHTDIYLGMYYVTPSRQVLNQFTIPFMPPFKGTLAMFGTATNIPTFHSLVEQQAAGLQGIACAPGGTALIDFVAKSFPGLQLQGILGGSDDVIYQAFQDGTCSVYITDAPVAAQFVLRRSQRGECDPQNNGKVRGCSFLFFFVCKKIYCRGVLMHILFFLLAPRFSFVLLMFIVTLVSHTISTKLQPFGLIGEPMDFGLSHYAIGVRQDIDVRVERTLSYWMNSLMSCNPVDPNGGCPEGNLATFFKSSGGRGDECGYVLFPEIDDSLTAGEITGIVGAIILFILGVALLLHRYRLQRQKRLFQEHSKATLMLATHERELNDYIAHEVRNPLSSALAALNFVNSKALDPNHVPNLEHRKALKEDLDVMEASLQFINELLRNMLDLHRSSAEHGMKLTLGPVDILKDVFEPISSILFMRGAKVDIVVDCCPKTLCVESDRMRLKQICLNLAANSSKFVQHGYIRLHAESIADNTNVCLHIEDSGPGIPPEKRDKLFTKFQESLDVLNQGTGIGLAVCKNLSLLLGANLFLDNTFQSSIEDCPGTKFTLQLNKPPLDLDQTTDIRPDEPGDLTDSARNVLLRRELPESISVLFVDDDMVLRKMFGRTLKHVAPNWHILEASNGETALRIVGEESFDVIFIDQYMASVEKQLLGTETVQAMRAKGVTSLICGLSANDLHQQFLDAGANAFMLKPFPCQKEALELELLDIFDNGTPKELEQRLKIRSNRSLSGSSSCSK